MALSKLNNQVSDNVFRAHNLDYQWCDAGGGSERWTVSGVANGGFVDRFKMRIANGAVIWLAWNFDTPDG